MAEDSGGLSDALRRMANAKLLASPPSEARRDPNPETGAGGGPERVLLAQLDEEPDPGPRPEGRRAPPRTATGHDQIKAVAVVLLLSVAGLLLIPAVWATLLLVGIRVWGSARPDAAKMAMGMLACWPIAVGLVSGAVLFYVQLRRSARSGSIRDRRSRTRYTWWSGSA